jgi:hypothetical protein
MDWISAVQHIVEKYSGQTGGTAAAPADPHHDFQQVTQAAPQDVVAGGISQAFRSDQTPPFPEMVSNLFRNSDPNQRAGLLERLMHSIGPRALATLPGLGGLSSMFGGGNVTPEQASRVSPEQVQQMAAHAQGQNPSVVDQVSNFYAQHPQVMKAAGGLALTIALQHILKRR